MNPGTKNSYKSLTDIKIDNINYKIFSLKEAEINGLDGISKLPKSLKVFFQAFANAFKSLSEKDKMIRSAGSCSKSMGTLALSK